MPKCEDFDIGYDIRLFIMQTTLQELPFAQ